MKEMNEYGFYKNPRLRVHVATLVSAVFEVVENAYLRGQQDMLDKMKGTLNENPSSSHSTQKEG